MKLTEKEILAKIKTYFIIKSYRNAYYIRIELNNKFELFINPRNHTVESFFQRCIFHSIFSFHDDLSWKKLKKTINEYRLKKLLT